MSVSFPVSTMYFSDAYELVKATQKGNIKLHRHGVEEKWRFSKYVSYRTLRWHFKLLDTSLTCTFVSWLPRADQLKSKESNAQWDNSLPLVSSPTNICHSSTTVHFLSFLNANSPGRKHVDKSALCRNRIRTHKSASAQTTHSVRKTFGASVNNARNLIWNVFPLRHLVCPANNYNTSYGRKVLYQTVQKTKMTNTATVLINALVEPQFQPFRDLLSPILKRTHSRPANSPWIQPIYLGNTSQRERLSSTRDSPSEHFTKATPELRLPHFQPPRLTAGQSIYKAGEAWKAQPTRCKFVTILASWPTSVHLALLQVFPRIPVGLKPTKHACLGRPWFHLSFSKASQGDKRMK